MLAIEVGDDIVVVDAGLMFPDEGMLGIDLVIPDITYLRQRKNKIRGFLITHAHEDHIGALPYALRDLLEVPIYGTKLTIGLIRTKLKEHKLAEKATFREIAPGTPFTIGSFRCDSYYVCHSIPDAIGVTIDTPYGALVHSGDWKFDHTPVDGRQTDFARLAAIAAKGVLLLMSDSTRAEVPGYTQTARELGYLDYPEGAIVSPHEIGKLADHELCIITTGSQGEPTSALSRMALGDHRHVAVKEGDTVVMSATPIPGNEELVSRTVDNLFKLGAEVIYDPQSRPHVSGHASQEELKLLLNILRPKHFLPIHGEYRMLVRHARLAMDLGVEPKNAFVLTNGDVLQFDEHGAHVGEKVQSGVVYVDGLGVGDVSQSVMRDRWSIGSDGIFLVVVTIEQRTGAVVAGPDIVTKGFVPEHDAAQLVEEAKQKILDGLAEAQTGEHLAEPSALKDAIHNSVVNFLYERTKRRPMVLPVIMQV